MNKNEISKIISATENHMADLKCISHSYFSEDANIMYFKHKSFAEILLAEYYLKTFISHALADNPDIEELVSPFGDHK